LYQYALYGASLDVMVKRNVQVARNQTRLTQLLVSRCITLPIAAILKKARVQDLVVRPRFERRLSL
jgi:hypothetical protein